MLEEAGYRMDIYDRCYAHVPERLTRAYDFITASEVVEHLREPGMELDRLWSCLRPGGVLGIMTKRVLDQKAFSTWHYIRDLTHISFFSRPTFVWLAKQWNASLDFADRDVVILHKKILKNDTSTVRDSQTFNQSETDHL
jgi:hypothetical protein